MALVYEQTADRIRQETKLVHDLIQANEGLSAGQMCTQVKDATRSNAFLLAESGLQSGERLERYFGIESALTRLSVLGTVATDLFSGYLILQQRARWLPWLVGPKDLELQHERGANRVLDACTNLGGALIKAGQFASTRPDLLPGIYIQRLSQLQDRMPPQDWSVIEAAINRELGQPWSQVFSRVEQKPVAAASLAQVHRAWLKDGRPVVLKVQYPRIRELVETDLRMLDYVAFLISQVAPGMNFGSIVNFLRETLPLELDLAREGRLMTELGKAFAGRDNVVVPVAYPEYSTGSLLVMEYIEGIKITDKVALEAHGIDVSEVVRLLNEIYAEQVFKFHLMHADPHPGNLMVQPGPRIVLLDHGLTVHLKPELAHAMGRMVKALLEVDFDELLQAFNSAGLKLAEGVDIGTLLQVAGVIFGGEEERNLAQIGGQLGRSVGEIPADLLLVGRALGMLNGICLQLDPNQATLETVAAYV